MKALFLPTDLYIPLSRVVSLDEAQSTFEVNVPKEKVEAMGWQDPPADANWDATDATAARVALGLPRHDECLGAARTAGAPG